MSSDYDRIDIADPMLRVLRKALDRVRNDINHAIEHVAKYPTIGRERMEADLVRYKEEEEVLLSSVALRTAVLSLNGKD